MDMRNFRAVESISNYCYYCGIIPLFLGILLIFMDVIDQEFDHILVGIFMSITGYAQVKISAKLESVLKEERKKIELASALELVKK